MKYILATVISYLDFIQKVVDKKFEEVPYKFKSLLTTLAEVPTKDLSYTPKENSY